MRYNLRSIDVLSAAKVSAFLHGCMGVLFIPFFLSFAVLGATTNAPGARQGAVIFVIFAIAMPFFYALMGFVVGALMSWLYNVISERFGPVRVDLDITQATRLPDPVV
ncbi:MAG TPA: hypothetical protein VF786_11315 [Terriglobales bacterium]